MATRSLMALDYSNYQTNNVLKKHARNRPLGAIEQRHNYVPAQPVLSCRTVDIDLLGTRTYRPKSTVDILEEQQRLIRTLRSRAAASAPPRPLTEPAPRNLTDSGLKKVNIEVQGRPFTSQSQSSLTKENQTATRPRRRPKTTGRLKNIQPVTDSFMVIKVDQDLLESSQNNRELTNKLHAYWRSDPQSLATGRFVRGQKRPDDVPPTLDAWLTFGGAAGEESQGVIDAFASFKNSEEYYNIEGSVGSRVAQQLQKGDKIRIGINGVVQSHDFRVKKWHKDGSSTATPQSEPDQKQLDSAEGSLEGELSGKASHNEAQEEKVETNEKHVKMDTDDIGNENDLDGAFKELVIGDLDDLLEDSAESNKPSPSPAGDAQSIMQQQATSSDKPATPPVIVPLSWDDQCTKPDVKVIQPTISPREQIRPVMSETYPVRFEKLISEGSRPRLAQARKDGYKIKQRPLSKTSHKPGASAKVKVVYIDPLTPEDEARVNTMSVEEIVNFKMDNRDRDRPRSSGYRGLGRENGKGYIIKKNNNANGNDSNLIAINDDTGPPVVSNQHRVGSPSKSGVNGGAAQRAANSRPNSHHSLTSDQARVASPKLKTIPVHPALQQSQAALTDLSITANSQKAGSVEPAQHKSSRSGTPSRSSPNKPASQRVGSGQGGPSIKAISQGHLGGAGSGEAEYIKITTQLKMGGVPFPSSSPYPVLSHPQHHQQTEQYQFSPGSNTPRDLDYQEALPENYYHVGDEPSPHEQSSTQPVTPIKPPHRGNNLDNPPARVGSASGDSKKGDVIDTRASSPLSESPPATTVAISIPTADELSDREESPSHSPARVTGISPDSAALTPMARRERDMRNEQIDQITDLIGGAITDGV
ncbi:hypothetical protein PoB_003980900 [Plakobranchus ocellatus]|uniref:Uncharacterized protein n=1 Tax=Plakobranchus ocellatus TaxID=259542 RepID=A0AAV4B4J2_9GAST|nr:hypothetical protein PoB_003980900 [Plakobranchus ocellatus]